MGNIIRRILGGIMILTALAIVGGSIWGATRVGDVLAGISSGITDTLAITRDTLATAADTITLTQQTIGEVGDGLQTASDATANLSGAIADTQPLMDNVGAIITDQLPTNLEAIQAALPNIISVAGVIDRTLTTLSGVGIERTIDLPFGQSIPISWDLGIDYNPEVPFDQSIATFQTTLDGLPESLRALEENLTVTSDNLGVLSDNLVTISGDLVTINQSVANLVPLLDQYTVLISDLQASIDRAEQRIPAQLEMVRMGAIAGLILLALSQLPGLYIGWELISGRRDPQPELMAVATVTKEVPSDPQ